MAKKRLMVVVLTALVAGGAFAQSEFRLSVGAGGYFTKDFGGGVELSMGIPALGDITVTYKLPYTGFGGFVFFDATYAEVSGGFFVGNGKVKIEGDLTDEIDLSYTGVDASLLLKFPIALGEQFAIFPLLGATYRLMLSVESKEEDFNAKPEDLNALWFRAGIGLDFSFTENLFLRGTVLYGIRLSNEFEKNAVDSVDLTGGVHADTKSLLAHGFEAKLALGFRF